MSYLELIATSTFGLEAVVAEEVKDLGYKDIKVENGKVTFLGDWEALCRANLWLRVADRVRLKVGEFKAVTFEELFEQTKALPWPELIPGDAEFPVEGKSVKSGLFSVSDCQAIVKKAVVESMKKKYRSQWFEEKGPLYKIEVALLKDTAVLTLDTTGAGLHKRGYRELSSFAPLKETLAAALIKLSHWRADMILVDPFCGSGTIPIEAALIGQNVAPGMNREFVSESWPNIPRQVWRTARKETHDLAKFDQPLEIIGTDINEKVLGLARKNAFEAGVDQGIHFQKMSFNEFRSRKKYGKFICNPPYGERLGQLKEVESMYRELGKFLKEFDTWSYYILSSHPDFESLLGERATKRRKLYNGNIKVHYYQYYGPKPKKRKERSTEVGLHTGLK
ncbi:THUMP domain-containing class I SAM-dependent RNA methyltransferase [Candidatus Contubernalis alkaliaceticus]|uniref:THUMP domain-containing class I SAM-dependent RNA methyltransferase n=1 Tax=Candidatus Contubernalis alkaliaceticus TaxID=338645 RepID=UPI001F4C2A2A|nr:class I SAM-dependent RNA methyltransferase [Candidatus Contubernalis alkalaceticus]UNC92691.1 class I SAM-dependent RNA methyltransferase [Candidatus Contubernalis alkalaceticus]